MGRLGGSALGDARCQIRNLAPHGVEERIGPDRAAMPHREGAVLGGLELPQPTACLLESHWTGTALAVTVGHMGSICQLADVSKAAIQTLRRPDRNRQANAGWIDRQTSRRG